MRFFEQNTLRDGSSISHFYKHMFLAERNSIVPDVLDTSSFEFCIISFFLHLLAGFFCRICKLFFLLDGFELKNDSRKLRLFRKERKVEAPIPALPIRTDEISLVKPDGEAEYQTMIKAFWLRGIMEADHVPENYLQTFLKRFRISFLHRLQQIIENRAIFRRC